MSFARLIGAAIVVTTGCYSPGAKDCSYTCHQGACPSGLTCLRNFCREDPLAQDNCSGDGGVIDGPTGDGATGYKGAVLASTPAAYWRLGELYPSDPVANESEPQVSGTISGQPGLGIPGALVTDPNPAIDFTPFNGVAACVSIDNSSTFNLAVDDSFSLEAWVRPDAQPVAVGSEIVGKLGTGSTTLSGYGLQALQGVGDLQLRLRIATGSTVEPSATAASPRVMIDRWTYIGVSFDASTKNAIFYVDGVQTGMYTFSNLPSVHNMKFTIGCSQYAGSDTLGFDGAIDEVAFYRRAVTANEFAAHFAAR